MANSNGVTKFSKVEAKGFIPTSYELTASGACPSGTQAVELNHATVVVAATITPVQGVLFVKDTSASGTAAHTLTLAAGYTFDGTNNTATLNAPNEALCVYIDSAGNGTILENVGTVALSSV